MIPAILLGAKNYAAAFGANFNDSAANGGSESFILAAVPQLVSDMFNRPRSNCRVRRQHPGQPDCPGLRAKRNQRQMRSPLPACG